MFQREVYEVLDGFEVFDQRDFEKLPPGRKPYFIGRLNRAFERNFKHSIREIADSGGVKFHFRSSGDPDGARGNLPTSTFLKKTAFYANQTVVSFPITEVKDKAQLRMLRDKPASEWPRVRERKSPIYFGDIGAGWRTPIGGVLNVNGKVYSVEREALTRLVVLLQQLRPAVEAGITRIYPSFPDEPRRFSQPKLGLTAANFRSEELRRQFFEHSRVDGGGQARTDLGLSHVLLPHFRGIPIERVLEIRDQEAGLYWEMQRRLERVLHQCSETDSETKILEFLRDVDQGIRHLDRRFHDIQKMYSRKNVAFLVGYLSVGLTMFAPLDPEAKRTLASIIGGINSFSFLTSKQKEAEARAELRGDDFYLPWQIFRAASNQ